jgi:hypothetical protein
MSSAVDPDVREFLLRNIESYEQLEVLLLLCRERAPAWTPEAVGEKVRLSTLVAMKALDDLTRLKLIDRLEVGRVTSYRFRPASSRTGATVEALLAAYDQTPLAIIHLMNTNALDRVRSAAARSFADAFIIDPSKRR